MKKARDKKLDVMEMRMLRWMCGVTKMDRMRNETIRIQKDNESWRDLIESTAK